MVPNVVGLINFNVNNVVNMSAFNAGLGPIGNYGGLFPTIPLLPGSPAIDAGVGFGQHLMAHLVKHFRLVHGTAPLKLFHYSHPDGHGARNFPE